MSTISTVLNNSFSQRQVSVMYGPLNQYHVVMGVDPRFAQDIESLKQVEVITATGVRVPMSAFARFEDANAPLSVQHQGLFVADTVSFSLAPGVSGPGHGGHRRGGGAHRAAVGSDPGGLPGHRRRPAADAGAAALADPGRPGHHVYRAGHPVRELRAPADHSVDAAIRRPGRAAGPADAAPGLHADRADRRVPADRHRQEKRHHDGGLRAGGRAHAGWRRATRSSRPA